MTKPKGDNVTRRNWKIFRPMPPEHFPAASVVATFNEEQNLVHYNMEIFDTLDPLEQRAVMQLDKPFLIIDTQ